MTKKDWRPLIGVEQEKLLRVLLGNIKEGKESLFVLPRADYEGVLLCKKGGGLAKARKDLKKNIAVLEAFLDWKIAWGEGEDYFFFRVIVPEGEAVSKRVEELLRTPEDEEGMETWEGAAGLRSVKNLYRFPYLREGEVRRILYGLHKVCPDDGNLYYRELVRAKREGRIPGFLLPSLECLDEELRIVVSEYGQERRVALFVLGSSHEVEVFNNSMEDEDGNYEEKIRSLVGDESVLIALTPEAFRFYRRLAGKLEKRVPWEPRMGGGELFEKIVKILEE